MKLSKGEVLQILPPHPWMGGFAVVEEIHDEQILVCVPRPQKGSIRHSYVLLDSEDYVPLGVRTWFDPVEPGMWRISSELAAAYRRSSVSRPLGHNPKEPVMAMKKETKAEDKREERKKKKKKAAKKK